MISAEFSSPTERRTTSSPAPACARCSTVSWRCVVEAGMNDKAARVADIGKMRKQPHIRNELHASVKPAF